LNGVTELGGKNSTFARPLVTFSICAAKRRSMSFHDVPSGEANCIFISIVSAARAGRDAICAPASAASANAPSVRRLTPEGAVEAVVESDVVIIFLPASTRRCRMPCFAPWQRGRPLLRWIARP
jgi:hypothetical protein